MRLSLKRGLVVEASVATALSRVLSLKSIRRMRLRSLKDSLACSRATEWRVRWPSLKRYLHLAILFRPISPLRVHVLSNDLSLFNTLPEESGSTYT
jgi:hypothetical protein